MSMSFGTPRYVIAVLVLLLARSGNLHAFESAPDFAKKGLPFLKKYCVHCHGGKKPKAELSLERYAGAASLVKQRKIWSNVVKMIVGGEMPPTGSKQKRPTVAEADAFVRLVRSVFDHADRNAKPDPGRITMRRLNCVEYKNTIRDLLGVDFDPTADFPSDAIGHGFDNIGEVLTVSPLLMERYLAASETIMSQAITPKPPPVPKRRLAAMYTEPASADVFKKVIEKGFRRMSTDGKTSIGVGPINTPYQWEAGGEYIFRTRVYGQSGTGKPLKVTILIYGKGLPNASPATKLDRLSGNVLRPARILKTFLVKATKREDAEVLEVRVPPMPNRHRMLIAIDKPAQGQPPAKLYIQYLALDGPLDTRPASHRRLLTTSAKKQAEKTREVLSRFVRRAFRRPPTANELDRVIRLAENVERSGESWEASIQFAMQAVLCSPKFLFRMELDGDPKSKKIRPLDEFALASRLSYFLWSTMPDDRLLELAEKKQLSSEFDKEVQRMLADPRASALVRNFAFQWLQIQRIDFISPDGKLFPTFNDKLRASMLKETELFVGSVFGENRSILELIDADYTYLNEPLARHYGIADTKGNPIGQKGKIRGRPIRGKGFQRVDLQGGVRGGLLTQASVLTVTSNPTRTSPVKRGRWVLEQILGAPPPPPPPNVPELAEVDEVISAGTLRKRMELHRRKPACANCHAKMDPIGFALENFDAVGAFRTKDGPNKVDASGEFPDGAKVDGPADLKKIILKRKDEFARCFSEKLLTYALGRGLQYYDRPALERIVKELAARDYQFAALVTQIVKSVPFRQRRGLAP